MSINKKALQSHILILILVSLIMTVLIVSVLSSIFVTDDIRCKDYDFEIESVCKEDTNVILIVKNPLENKMIWVDINQKVNQSIKPEENFRFSVRTLDEDIVIVPFFIDTKDEVFWCTGSKEKLDYSLIKKC